MLRVGVSLISEVGEAEHAFAVGDGTGLTHGADFPIQLDRAYALHLARPTTLTTFAPDGEPPIADVPNPDSARTRVIAVVGALPKSIPDAAGVTVIDMSRERSVPVAVLPDGRFAAAFSHPELLYVHDVQQAFRVELTSAVGQTIAVNRGWAAGAAADAVLEANDWIAIAGSQDERPALYRRLEQVLQHAQTFEFVPEYSGAGHVSIVVNPDSPEPIRIMEYEFGPPLHLNMDGDDLIDTVRFGPPEKVPAVRGQPPEFQASVALTFTFTLPSPHGSHLAVALGVWPLERPAVRTRPTSHGPVLVERLTLISLKSVVKRVRVSSYRVAATPRAMRTEGGPESTSARLATSSTSTATAWTRFWHAGTSGSTA